MASATLTPTPTDRGAQGNGAGRKLDAELGQAARRIRAADVLRGALALAVLTLAYVLATMTLDRSVELPAEARLVGLVGYALAALGVGYFALYRPLACKLNPRYTARRIEETAEDAKNAVINYVDLQDADMAEAVRARLAARAAQEVGGADTRRLSESKSVVWLLVGAGLLVAALAVCFLVFRPGPFWSLLKRAVHPYTTATIATKTELELLAPESGNASVLSGDTLTVRAHVGGRLPDAGEPDEPRLLVRYSPEAEPEVYALEAGASPRDLARALPPRVLQNGLFYRVSAGDATTPEYRIDVRPRPTILKSQARYDYPAYTRLKPETADGPAVEGLRGTAVALTVTANRPLKTAALSFDAQSAELPGEIDPADGARATFRFTLGESTSYRVRFAGAEGDPGEPFGPHPVKVARDDRPVLTITAPKETETALPANGLLAVDGIASDDFGLTQVRLRMQLAGPRPTELQSVFYKAGKPLKRPSDGTDPTRLEVQLSQSLSDAKFADGRPANLGENAVLEFWLEALDNCTVPNPNAGRSEVKRVKLGPPETSPPAKQQQDEKREQRRNQEQEQQKRQDQQQAGEQRDPNQPRPDATDDRRPKDGQKPPEGQKSNDTPNQGANEPKQSEPGQSAPPKSGNTPPQPGKAPEPNQGAGQPNGGEPKQPQGAETPPKSPGAEQPKNQGQQAEGDPQSGGKSQPPSAEQQRAKQEARELQRKLNQERGGKPESAPEPREQAPSQQEIEQAARDLNSSDPGQKQKAEETLDRAFGKDARERAQQEAEQLKNDLNSPDEAKKQAAQDKLKDLAEQAEKRRQEEQNKPQPKDGGKQDKPNSQQSNNDPNASGSGKTPQGQPEGGDPSRKSPPSGGGKGGDTPKPGDAPKAQPGQQQSGGQSTGNPKPPEGDPAGQPEGGNPGAGGPSQVAKDLTSPDDAKRAEAERDLDRKAGPEKRKEIQDGLKSDKPAERKAAQDKLDQYAPPGQEGKPSGEKPPAGQQPTPKGGPSRDEIKDAASKLNSPDPAERKQAQDTIDKAIGKEAREQAQKDAEQLKKDLTGDDPAKQKSAREKLDKLAKDLKEQQAKENAANAPKSGGEPEGGAPNNKKGGAQAAKDAEKAARDLANGTPEEKQAARDTLDKTVGESKRQEIEKQTEDATKAAQSGGAKEQADAKRKLDDVAKQAGQDAAGKSGGQSEQGEQGEGKQPSPEEVRAAQEKAKQLADDLTGDDQAKREAAEKAVDDQIGKEKREQLQRDLKDAKSDDPAKSEAAKRRLEKGAEEAANKADGRPQKDGKPGEPGPGGGGRPEGERVPVKDDPLDRLRTAELQLADFEKVKADPALQKRLGYTPEQYQRFLDSFRKVVETERAAVKEAEAKTPAATGPKVDLSTGSKGRKVEAKPGAGSVAGSAVGKAPPGYSEAQRRFAEEAAKGQQPAPQR